jgi:NAD(P)-dependent dehydrogenase (short-subunit alcohol dehydrogenase family)
VTGAGSGIGRATALEFAAEGAAVAVVDKRPDAADDVAAAVRDSGGSAVAFTGDVSDEAFISDVMRRAAEQFGGLDTLVAGAGITIRATTEGMALEAWEAIIRVNLTGAFLTIKHAIPELVAAGAGAIVTLGSVASLVAGGSSPAYDASKGGVLQLTRSVAAEYADRGIRANCVCPSLVLTDIAANSEIISGFAGDPSRVALGWRVPRPIDRGADPSEIAQVIAFLCSDEASFITGAAIPVDGGHTAI